MGVVGTSRMEKVRLRSWPFETVSTEDGQKDDMLLRDEIWLAAKASATDVAL